MYQSIAALQMLCAQRNVPCVVCCQIGKDRTGVIVALVMGVLDFTKDAIAEEYARSEVSREVQNYCNVLLKHPT